MRKLIGLIAVLVFAVSTVSALPTVQFRDVPYSNSVFSVLFPVGSDVMTEQGDGTATYTVALNDDMSAFSVSYRDFDSDPNTDLDAAIHGAFGDTARDVSITDATLSGLRARQGRAIDTDEHGIYREYTRIAMRGRRAILGLVMCHAGNCTEADANRFFDSIQFK